MSSAWFADVSFTDVGEGLLSITSRENRNGTLTGKQNTLISLPPPPTSLKIDRNVFSSAPFKVRRYSCKIKLPCQPGLLEGDVGVCSTAVVANYSCGISVIIREFKLHVLTANVRVMLILLLFSNQ